MTIFSYIWLAGMTLCSFHYVVVQSRDYFQRSRLTMQIPPSFGKCLQEWAIGQLWMLVAWPLYPISVYIK